MDEKRLQKLKEKLSYISKSKRGNFKSCPKAFYYTYVCEEQIEEAENPFFKIGIDVHDFIDNFFDIIKIENKQIVGLSNLIFHPNTPYKKNVVKFELERFEAVKKAGFDLTYFLPTVKEKRWTTQNPKLIGIVDRVHKCFKNDIFAPKHKEFKDGDLVIVENKTGKPTAQKCKDYEEDMLWYKIIMEIVQPELAPIRWGAIYFPYDNYVYHCQLKIEDCRKLAADIKKVREGIMQGLDTGFWPATPSSWTCNWCSYKNECGVAYKR
jgi:CRISPR/Cas system-associated exonuclease Cas4 (RecB family)